MVMFCVCDYVILKDDIRLRATAGTSRREPSLAFVISVTPYHLRAPVTGGVIQYVC